MPVCNNKNVDFYLNLSSDERILIGSVSHDSIAETSISIDDDKSELGGYMQLVANTRLSAIPFRYDMMCQALGITGKSRAMAIPRNILQSHLIECLRQVQCALDDVENYDYMVTYLSNRRFLEGLSRASIDECKLLILIRESTHGATTKSLRSFLPDYGEKCKRVKYSSVNTLTGRLTVTDGPQILTAPSAVRSCIKSSRDCGKVLQIDIISAEPKFALCVKGDDVPVDVYAYVAEHILGGVVDRHHAKLITLCALYGQSPRKLKDKLPKGVSVMRVIKETKKYFGYEMLVAELRHQSANGKFRNAVGRPLEEDQHDEHLLISHYLQSSIAEGALLMFSDFIERFSNRCNPIFVIHDALIIDCESEFANSLLEDDTIKLSLGQLELRCED